MSPRDPRLLLASLFALAVAVLCLCALARAFGSL
jgi:hypothetical protein